ncbi:ribosome biogenesis GTPase YlqF [Thermoactinomyces intermedius]|jgi:ribosome biogenesis GTPase A|uniref:Ribosome biogenesis GTPase A n=1 Tax=Thermoactinomyces intermedius TaxID=2024 RepID=A0A8I1A4G0_THEIN|nr:MULTISPECIES: ribosome biogenesis GTPase YlqF [Thermoactinomyces]MBA4547462.1 ribosome biogenesis GTPase YlqF [Thermoactinomyces intermedius]MBA4836112.1 ribosome biogenesis GTPase YlqF [Thermoactinomyces intermedius]MBH8594308.1 ribosome biogenesis GTPase YlqF [Thermoactinomyces intermedius]MBH8601144.1 ribosome biogenesis GTPase YlqF [Thermoactinomyces sp. CICC 23799]
MTIQWFPGHMAKARRQVEEKLKLVDIVFELLDARLPLSSRNPMMDEILKDKPRLILLTKCDLADERANQAWMKYFQARRMPVLPVDAQTGKGVQQIIPACEKILAPLFQQREKKGIQSRKFRAMVTGIPNVGKSSLINRLAKRSVAETGDRPGVTKAQQWIRVGKTMELLDTPGILWPKFDDPVTGLRLAASGAIKETILPIDEVALYVLNYLKERYPDRLKKRYKLEQTEQDGVALMEEIGKKRGCLLRGGEIDYEKVAELLLHELRAGRLGRISFEFPEDWIGKEEMGYAGDDRGN